MWRIGTPIYLIGMAINSPPMPSGLQNNCASFMSFLGGVRAGVLKIGKAADVWNPKINTDTLVLSGIQNYRRLGPDTGF